MHQNGALVHQDEGSAHRTTIVMQRAPVYTHLAPP